MDMEQAVWDLILGISGLGIVLIMAGYCLGFRRASMLRPTCYRCKQLITPDRMMVSRYGLSAHAECYQEEMAEHQATTAAESRSVDGEHH